MITYVSDKLHSYFCRDHPDNRKFKFIKPTKPEIEEADAWVQDLIHYGWSIRKKPSGLIYSHVVMLYREIEEPTDFNNSYVYEYDSPNIIWAYNGLDEISSNGKCMYSFPSERRLVYKTETYPNLYAILNAGLDVFYTGRKPVYYQTLLFD